MQQLTGKSWKTNYGAVLIAETFAMIGFSCSMPVIPLFLGGEIGIKNEEELKLWNGAIQSCSAVALAVFAPIWGKLADNYSRRAMLMRAMFAGSIFVSLISFARRPWQILVLRTIQGSLTGTISAATVLTVGIVPVSSLAIALGMLQTGIAAGNTIGPLIGGVITDFLGHRAAFLATGIFLFSAGLIVTFGVHEDKTIISTQAKTKKEKRKIFP
ncbi:MAG: MFS transporter, partial [Spirochaetaceae bacterium]|nr:MFS transporter [Spirochaetaceae bacterium]